MFFYLFSLGMTVGIFIYALTFLFVRQGHQKRRVGIITLAGLLIVLSSMIFIGGFEGMPYGMIGLGTLSSSILLLITTSFTKWTKFINFIIFILFSIWTVYLLTQYHMEKEVDYWIVNEHKLAKKEDAYSQNVRRTILEKEDEGKKGYTLVQLENGKGIIVSLGKDMKGKKIKVKNVVEQKNQMIITIDIVPNAKNEKNPTTLIGVPFYTDHLIIKDTTDKTYHEISEK